MISPLLTRSLSRRGFMLSTSATALSLFAPPVSPSTLAPAHKPILVCLFLRGAADALSVVVPHAEPEYYRVRPNIAIAPPGRPNGAISLDARFGLHPALASLGGAYEAGELAIVHAVGSPHPTRSHFEAQDYMETAMPGRAVQEGWLGRYLHSSEAARVGADGSGSLRALAISNGTPLALRGYPNVVTAPRLQAFGLRARADLRRPLERAFLRMYTEPAATAVTAAEASSSRDALLRTGHDALTAARRLRELDLANYQPEHGATYTKASTALREVAAVIKADVGLELAWLDVGGWDTHQNQGDAARGRLTRLLSPLGEGIAAFRRDLGPRFADVLVLVLSEFGRTVAENGTGGTDHGHGGVMFLLGGRVRGGSVYGHWPGLDPTALWEGRDLPVTSDFRDIYAEIARHHLGHQDLARLLPGHAPGPELGLFRV